MFWSFFPFDAVEKLAFKWTPKKQKKNTIEGLKLKLTIYFNQKHLKLE